MKITLIAATTLDGKIAQHPKHMTDWTSPEDKDFMRGMLDKCDVILVGNTTYGVAYDPLSKRNCIVFTRAVEEPSQASPRCVCFNPAHADIHEFMKQQGYQSAALLGGARVYTFFLEKDAIDELCITIEPRAFGTGVPLFSTKKPVDKSFKLDSMNMLGTGGSVLLRYIREES